ncbi:MAG: transcriptional regulator, TetR family [Caulobacter sp.]|nr:transcriptional regulator, TetR family [Caulobacter sp.]
MNAPLPRLDPDTRREIILSVARDVFLEAGYAAASMATIAARLGGSKGTLYNYFKSKEELFEAVVTTHCSSQQQRMEEIAAEGDDVRGSLKRMGQIYLDIILAEHNLAFFRLVVAEAVRSPEIGRLFYESAMMGSTRRIADFLSRMVEAGALKLDDPALAAQHFMALCQSRLHKARLFRAIPATEIDAEIEHAIDTFLAAFAVKP